MTFVTNKLESIIEITLITLKYLSGGRSEALDVMQN